LGSGDAFGSGGRLQACVLLEHQEQRLLLDCGTTALIALKRDEIDPCTIDAVIVSHLHGDHFAGLAFLLLDGQFNSRRRHSLTIAGPCGIEERLRAAMEILFPGSLRALDVVPHEFIELTPGQLCRIGGATVACAEVDHACGAMPLALRVEIGERVIAYSGDTAWTDSLVEIADGADLFICEAYFYDKAIPYHVDYRTVRDNLERLGCRRIVLTHASADLLHRLGEIDLPLAEDGMRIAV
jgi:ribonuclease BN (tRNA processing enzyme)